MSKLFKREYATSLTAVTFLLIAVSGVMRVTTEFGKNSTLS